MSLDKKNWSRSFKWIKDLKNDSDLLEGVLNGDTSIQASTERKWPVPKNVPVYFPNGRPAGWSVLPRDNDLESFNPMW